MFHTRVPIIQTEEWPFENTKPTAISVDKARKLLADAYADIPCEIQQAGTHGYAWVIETKEQWLERDGITEEVTAPQKPRKSDYDFSMRVEFSERLEQYKLYNHMMQQGKAKLLEWFGDTVFDDLCLYGAIPATTTPKELLAHLVASIEDDPDLRLVSSSSKLYITTTRDSSGRNKSSKRVSVYANLNLHNSPVTQIRLFSPPRQRQKWGSDQILPHVNWGDLFFDLFYVAAFYNLGNILVDDPSPLGILYFLGGFFSVIIYWFQKLIYDAQFATGHDIFHKVFEIAALVVLATNVSSIATVTRMSNPSEYIDVFVFALSRTILCLMHIVRYLECICVGRGQRENIVKVAATHIQFQLLPLCLYTAATVLSGLAYFANNKEVDAYYGNSYYEDEYSDEQYDDKLSNYTVDKNNGVLGVRNLAEGDYESSDCDYSNTSHLPIILLLAGYVCYQLAVGVKVSFLYNERITIPMNVDFVIHRLGELTMLVLGESILSLLIVDGDDGNYHQTFYFGIVTVMLLMVLHFQTQPHDANSHAMRRSKNAGVLYSQTYQIYCAALVAVGASYKIFMYYIAKDKKRRFLSHMTHVAAEEIDARWLAGGGGSSCGPYGDEKKEMTAHLFSWSMGLVFICMDIMQFAHVGLEKNIENCKLYEETGKGTQKRKSQSKWRFNLKVLFFIILPRGGITIFVLTVGFWETNPRILPALGFAAVMAQLFSRLLGKISVPEYELNNDHHSHQHHEGVSDDGDDGREETTSIDKYSPTSGP